MRKSLIGQLIELLAIPLSHQKTVAKRLVIAIRPGRQTTPTKSLVMLRLLGVIVALALSTAATAIGMGGIDVDSALGQPLNADIGLTSVNKNQKSSLVARLASPDVYKGAGLQYPYGNKFQFQIENRANGELYLKVSSEQPINDPFVSLLVELTWSSGKLLREYTFLLDPPGYVAERPAPAKVQPVAPLAREPLIEQSDLESGAAHEVLEPAKEAPQPMRASKADKPDSTPAPRAPEKQTAASIATGNITVRSGDTLTRIALQNKLAEVSLEQMLVALYRANAEQFDANNMNRIRAGKILRLPDQSELMNVTQSDAKKEIRAHVADWNIYRQKLASAASVASQSQGAQQIATGKIASSVADKAPIARESAKEVLKLSKGDVPGDSAAAGAAAGKSASAEARKNAAQEDAIAKDKATKDEQARVALLEKNLKDMERLAELKSGAAALAASAAKPEPAAKPIPKVVEPEAPSLFDEILDEPLYLVGGAAVLLGLGGLGFMMYRRRHAYVSPDEVLEDEIGAKTGHMTAPVMPSPDTGDFTSMPAEKQVGAAPPADEVDPISEADLFLNFGRDAQAEDILKEALRNTPNNHQIHLRLLGIYANRKDVGSFSSIARQLQDSGDEEAWQQAVVMGRKLEPKNPLYGAAQTVEDADSATMKTAAHGASATRVVTPAVQEASTPEVDFDLGMSPDESDASSEPELLAETESTAALSSAEKDAAKATAMDFDVTSTNPSMAAPDAMDFDITSTHPPMPAVAVQAEEAEPSGIDFDITSTHPPMPAAAGQAEKAAPSGMDDLIFDVTSTNPPIPAPQPEPAEPAIAAQDDGGMEFTLDFPVEDAAEKPAHAARQADVGLSGISLNLDDVAEPDEPAARLHDERWHEVATKLDLARAYQEMGDLTGAREIIEEVLREGDEEQRQTAQTLLDQLD